MWLKHSYNALYNIILYGYPCAIILLGFTLYTCRTNNMKGVNMNIFGYEAEVRNPYIKNRSSLLESIPPKQKQEFVEAAKRAADEVVSGKRVPPEILKGQKLSLEQTKTILAKYKKILENMPKK